MAKSSSPTSGTDDRIVALLCADLHLSLKPPAARSCEADWLAVQARYLKQLRELANQRGGPVTIICGGDVLDKWNAPAELINWCIVHLPRIIAIPGNHDLPPGGLIDIRKTAYWTLVQAGIIINLEPGKPSEIISGLRLHGFPPGRRVGPLADPHDLLLEVAVAHDYIWSENKKTGYHGAPEEKKWQKQAKNFQGYDVAIFGDNHSHFQASLARGMTMWNCGTFLRRKMDERHLEPCVGLLHADGSVSRHRLSCSDDKFVDAAEQTSGANTEVDFKEFIGELEDLPDKAIDFRDAVLRWLGDNNVPPVVREIALRAMENEK